MKISDQRRQQHLDEALAGEPAAKRGREQQWSLDSSGESDSMRVDTLPSCSSDSTMSADDILVEMIKSGQYSHTQVVQFCLSSGIPLSRMLRLDLMRLNNSQMDTL